MENTSRPPLPLTTTGCACRTPAPESASASASGQHGAREAEATTSAGTLTFLVAGMTCGHCVSSVMEEVSALDGVTAVDVDLAVGSTSTVTVTGTATDHAVRAAIEEAGYTPTA